MDGEGKYTIVFDGNIGANLNQWNILSDKLLDDYVPLLHIDWLREGITERMMNHIIDGCIYIFDDSIYQNTIISSPSLLTTILLSPLSFTLPSSSTSAPGIFFTNSSNAAPSEVR